MQYNDNKFDETLNNFDIKWELSQCRFGKDCFLEMLKEQNLTSVVENVADVCRDRQRSQR